MDVNGNGHLHVERRYEVFVQKWERSRRGVSVRPDGTSLHLTLGDCEVFVKKHWEMSGSSMIPNEYSRPCGAPFRVQTDAETYFKVESSRGGIRYPAAH